MRKTNLTDEQFQALLAAARGTNSEPAAQPEPELVGATAESAPAAPVTESEDQRIARLVAEQVETIKRSLVQDLVESGTSPTRKGLVQPVNESTYGAPVSDSQDLPEGWPQKPLHEYSRTEWERFVRPDTEKAVMGHRSVNADR